MTTDFTPIFNRDDFDASVFHTADNQEVVIAFRGTDPGIGHLPDWGVANIPAGQVSFALQVAHAIKLVADQVGSKLTVALTLVPLPALSTLSQTWLLLFTVPV